MMFEIHNTHFLRPSELVRELLVLQQIRQGDANFAHALPTHRLSRTELIGAMERLKAGGMVTAPGPGGEVALTPEGEQQLRVLLVDYIRELVRLYEEVIAVFQRRLAEYYMRGVRRVAFYPVSDTAEVVYLALQTSGLTLVAAVDDDPSLWGSNFHALKVQSPAVLSDLALDGVVCTTAVFEKQIGERMASMKNLEGKLLSLW